MNSGNLRLVCDSPKNFNVKVVINPNKVLIVVGGKSYETNMRVEDSDGNSIGKLRMVTLDKINGIFIFKNEGGEISKAKVLLRCDENPGLASFYRAVDNALDSCVTTMGLPKPRPLVASGLTNDKGELYSDSSFIQLLMDQSSVGCFTGLFDLSTKQYILSNEKLEMSDIRSYAKAASTGNKFEIINLVKDIYGYEITIDPSTKKVTIKDPKDGKVKNTNKLLAPEEFKETMRQYKAVSMISKFKQYYTKSNDTEAFLSVIAIKVYCIPKPSSSELVNDEEDYLIQQFANSNTIEDLAPAISPDDLLNQLGL
jgi:hypothetical protein